MKISYVKLKNVKCFSDKEILLTKPGTKEPLSVCALVGANGSGKSAILKAVVALFSEINPEYGGELFVDENVYVGSQESSVIVELQLSEAEAKLTENQYPVITVEYKHFCDKDKEKKDSNLIYFPMELANDVVENIEEITEEQMEKLRGYIRKVYQFFENKQTGLIMYYDPFRFVSKKNPSGPVILENENAKTRSLSYNIDSNGENTYRDLELKQWVVNMDYLRLKNPSEKNIAVYNHIIKAIDLLLHPLKFETINTNGSLEFLNEQDGKRITIDMLSDGFKSIFSIVLDIIRRLALAPDYGDVEFFEKEAVILIDEIDCHIHPKWQRKLVPAFRELFPNCQFIITTHSPYILDTLQEYEIRKIGEKEIL